MSRVQIALAVCSLGCTNIADVDQYTFDRDPCPRVETCLGGRTYFYASAQIGLTRLQDDGSLDGFDLDGTEAEICGRPDRIAPDGRRGIDNESGPLLAMFEAIGNGDFASDTRERLLQQGVLPALELDNVDDLENDDCVVAHSRYAVAPEGSPASYLDADMDGYLDPGLLLDYRQTDQVDATACIIDGRLHVRYAGPVAETFYGVEVRGEQPRVRVDVSEDRLSNGIYGGSIPLTEIFRAWDELGVPGIPALMTIARDSADLDPVDGRCTSLSTAFTIEYVHAQMGVVRP
jgi:hypothetical protein